MGIGKQAKVLSKANKELVLAHIATSRQPTRNRLIFLLSVNAGLRAKEIAALKWSMVLDAGGEVADNIALDNAASKGSSGRLIPISKVLRQSIEEHLASTFNGTQVSTLSQRHVISTSRSDHTSAQALVNLFIKWYRAVGLQGCSSHSGRRTFITNAARKISTVGGSLRDVQALAGHSSLQTTQRYIEGDAEARRRIVDLV